MRGNTTSLTYCPRPCDSRCRFGRGTDRPIYEFGRSRALRTGGEASTIFIDARPHRNRVGHKIVRHICADGLLSRPRPSYGCLKLRPMMSTKSSRLTLAFGSNEELSFTQMRREVMYHLCARAPLYSSTM